MNDVIINRSASKAEQRGISFMRDRLVQKLKEHDEKALSQIIEQYSRFVASVVYNTAKASLSKEDVEEVTADVFVTLWNNANKVQEGKLKGYICSVTKTRALNKIKRCRNKAVLNIDDYDPEDDFSIADETEKKDIHRELREVITEIPQPDREILIRYYYYNQTVSLIAEKMKINFETVKSKLRRTREKIKVKLIERSYMI